MKLSGQHELEFHEIIPQLAGLYRKGLLVPFIGAGMSAGICCNWNELLRNLAIDRNLISGNTFAGNHLTSADIIRYADEIVNNLRAYKEEDQIKFYRKALLASPASTNIPKQAQALAKLYWPLVISTNYDDVLWSAIIYEKPVIAGRGVQDCHLVLHSLDEVSPPLLWAIQGFIGGQLTDAETVINDPSKRMELANQIVLGHQQYQKAINSSTHFRRAFAEVFRRRSLIFMGSGILEDYLVNLFSEILHHQGSSAHIHFALLHKDERKRYDSLFMQRQLGIVPIFYDDHSYLPEYLDKFSSVIKYWLKDEGQQEAAAAPFILQDEIGFKLSACSSNGVVPLKVNICKAQVPVPGNNECAVVSIGRDHNFPKIGSQVRSFMKKAVERKLIPENNGSLWRNIDKHPAYVFRYNDAPIFAVAARRKDVHINNHDIRDLSIIDEAVCTALQKIDELGFETVHLGAIAAGKHRHWDAIHPFAQTLRGIRKWVAKATINHIRRINLYLIDPATWSSVVSQKINIESLLTSDISCHTIEITDTSGIRDSFTLTLKESPTLKQLLELCKINKELWKASVYPLPSTENMEIPDDLIITSTMRVTLTPVSKPNDKPLNGANK